MLRGKRSYMTLVGSALLVIALIALTLLLQSAPVSRNAAAEPATTAHHALTAAQRPAYYAQAHARVVRLAGKDPDATAAGKKADADREQQDAHGADGAAQSQDGTAGSATQLQKDAPRRETGSLTADQFEYLKRAAPGRRVPFGPRRTLLSQVAAILTARRAATTTGAWSELGPRTLNNGNNFPEPVSGRTLAVAVDPTNAATIYAGTAQGGVWKSTDAGQTWTPLTDAQPSLSINALAIDPQNPQIIYAGTGEDNGSCDAYNGFGILRSTDGGATWSVLGATVFAHMAIGNIILDPRSTGNAATEHLYVSVGQSGQGDSATSSCFFGTRPGETLQYGVYESQDGGATWRLSLPAGTSANNASGVSDMAMAPGHPDRLYAGVQGRGIYVTTNGGTSWTLLHGGLPRPIQIPFDRIQLAIAPSNALVIYAAYDDNFASMLAYKSTNGGITWRQLSGAPDVCDGQCWYDMPVTVSPTDPNTVFIGGNANYAYIFTRLGQPTTPADCQSIASLFRLPADCNAAIAKSSDGGQTWQDIELGSVNFVTGLPIGATTLHPDDHAIVFDPNNAQTMYTGNDGGLFKTTDGGRSWSNLNPGLGTLQFQSVAVGSDGTIIGGTQDNGTEARSPVSGTVWTSIDGGDGGIAQIDPQHPCRFFHTYAGTSLVRSDDCGASFTEIDFPFLNDPASFYPPFTLAPSQGRTVYYGTYRIWRSDDAGGSGRAQDWSAISPNLTGILGVRRNGCNFACISAVAVSPVNPNVVVVGTGNGLLWQSTNADGLAPRWRQINTATLPNRFITSIAFAPGSSTTVYVTYSGYDENTGSTAPGHLFTTNGIGSLVPVWTRIDGAGTGQALPDEPINSVIQPAVGAPLYAAGDIGVFQSTDNGAHWAPVTAGLPNVEVFMLAYDASTNALVAATHGRGMWSLPLG